MALTASEQLAPGDGRLWVASVGTTAPANAQSTPSNFSDLGYVSEDGVKVNIGTEYRAQRAWQALRDIGKVKTSETIEITFDLKQFNEINLALAWGGGTWSTPSTGVRLYTPPAASAAPNYKALIFDFTDGVILGRFVFARGVVSNGVETTYSRGDDSMLPITFAITPASDSDAPYLFYKQAAS